MILYNPKITMSIICTLEKKRTGDGYYARSRKFNRVGFDEFAREISHNCSASEPDVILVLTELAAVMRQHLLDGDEIVIPRIGSFHVGVKSASVVNPDEFDVARHIKGTHIKFRPTSKRDPMTWRLTKPMLDGAEVRLVDERPVNTWRLIKP